MALSDDAKAELREAIRIVREDRLEGYIRKRFAPEKKDPLITEDPPKDPPKDPAPTPPGPTPPPAKDPVTGPDPETDPKPKKRKGYWGELLDE